MGIKHIIDVNTHKNWKQATAFYFFYLFSIIAFSFLNAGLVFGKQTIEQKINNSALIGIFIIVVMVITMIFKRKIYKNPFYLIIALLAPLLYFLGGIYLALIPVAFLTTRRFYA